MTATPAPLPHRRLAIFLDGTWNQVTNNTNVWRLKALCAQADSDGTPQAAYYDIGVHGLVGGTFGRGLGNNIIKAYKWLIEEYTPGDDIFIFGFSRGAYTARSLAGLIAKYGLLKLGAPLGIDQIYERYKRANDKTIWKLFEEVEKGILDINACSLEERWLLKYSQRVPIKMVGVWDTVGKIGVPFGRLRGISSSTLGFFHTGLRKSIESGYHAIAIDERRNAFPPTLWTVRKPHDPNESMPDPRPLSSVEQRWFIGAHGNVGGGYPSDILVQIPLRWMAHKASLLGLAFRNEVDLEGDLSSAEAKDSHREFLWGWYQIISPIRRNRKIDGPPKVDKAGTHLYINETIDHSVFVFWRTGSYRPKTVAIWAKAKKVDPANITTSVLASDPSVAVPD